LTLETQLVCFIYLGRKTNIKTGIVKNILLKAKRR